MTPMSKKITRRYTRFRNLPDNPHLHEALSKWDGKVRHYVLEPISKILNDISFKIIQHDLFGMEKLGKVQTEQLEVAGE